MRSSGPTGVPPGAPRNDAEVRQLLDAMGFAVGERAAFGALQGYWLHIADPARAGRFGFSAWPQGRATAGGTGTTSRIACWTEPEGDHLVVWIDWRTVSIRDASRLPPYVRLYAK